ncbi:cyclic nucleotide-binding domain-containing protein [candidate division KSB1 bacterium]|nr:cyclic nucleotide-binding domain-containing protein [candidate division KSB1 bacterium]
MRIDNENIKRFTAFESLSEKELRIVLKYLHYRQYDETEYVYRQQTPSTAIYFLDYGTVQLVNREENKDDRLEIIKAGSGFGYSALLENSRRSHSAQCLEKCSCLALLHSDISYLRKTEPWLMNHITQHIVSILLQRIGDLEHEYIHLTRKLAQSDIVV